MRPTGSMAGVCRGLVSGARTIVCGRHGVWGVGEMLVDGSTCQFDQEACDAVTDKIEIQAPLFCGCLRRVADGTVIVKPGEVAAGANPALPERLEAERARVPGACLLEFDQLWI